MNRFRQKGLVRYNGGLQVALWSSASGLRKFYPNLKALKEKEPQGKRKKRSRKKRVAKPRAEEVPARRKPDQNPKGKKITPIFCQRKEPSGDRPDGSEGG
jgi:hypothetical protein